MWSHAGFRGHPRKWLPHGLSEVSSCPTLASTGLLTHSNTAKQSHWRQAAPRQALTHQASLGGLPLLREAAKLHYRSGEVFPFLGLVRVSFRKPKNTVLATLNIWKRRQKGRAGAADPSHRNKETLQKSIKLLAMWGSLSNRFIWACWVLPSEYWVSKIKVFWLSNLNFRAESECPEVKIFITSCLTLL